MCRMKFAARIRAFVDSIPYIVVLAMCIWVVGLYGDWTSPGSALIEQFTQEATGRILLHLVLAIVLAIALHELGHVTAGLLVGFRFLKLSVGPFLVQRTPAGLRLGINRTANVTGGVAAMAPTGNERLAERMRWMILGGPIANFVVAVVATGFSAKLGSELANAPRPQLDDYLAWSMLNTLGLISFAFFVLSLVPMTAKGLMSDGRRLGRLLQRGAAAEREVALLLLTGLSVHGTRPRDLPEASLRILIQHDDRDLFAIVGRFIGYFHQLDHGAPDKALELLRAVLAQADRLPLPTRQMVEAEHSYWLATFQGATIPAREALRRAGRCELAPAALLRAQAAVLLAEGNQRKAKDAANEALAALRTRTTGVTPCRAETEWLADIVRRSEQVPPILAV